MNKVLKAFGVVACLFALFACADGLTDPPSNVCSPPPGVADSVNVDVTQVGDSLLVITISCPEW